LGRKDKFFETAFIAVFLYSADARAAQVIELTGSLTQQIATSDILFNKAFKVVG